MIEVILPLSDGTSIIVGKLTLDESQFTFVYSIDFQTSELPPLPGFPNKSEKYKSNTLFPFFEVRIPPHSRADVARVLREHQVLKGDVFKSLRVLGRQALASPYELRTEESREVL